MTLPGRLLFPAVCLLALSAAVQAASPAPAESKPVPPTPPTAQFKTLPGFKVEPVLGTEAGSIINLAFNEDGDLLVSREGGGLYVVKNLQGGIATAKATLWEDKVRDCEGILAYQGHVYAVGNGPDGPALYRLTDTKASGMADKVETMFRFAVPSHEHGPHAVLLGPDGYLYVVSGDFSWYAGKYAPSSPHRGYYEGDLVQPRYEDPSGFATGFKAPGGVVMRCDVDGHNVELFCGGFRNTYDAAFNRAGELFTFDADMEYDEGLPWYRPIRVNHVVSGGEYGWRSGFAKWPDYFVDTLGAVFDVGRGSPTGMFFYDHSAYPAKYRDALFMCDWSRGRILVSHLERDGATYKGTFKTFLEGVPLNATDAEVGPDGAIYFATGGRDSQGGVFRAVWNGLSDRSGRAPILGPINDPGTDAFIEVRDAILQPQLQSGWGRAAVAKIREKLGDRWGPDLIAVANDANRLADDRARALELSQIFGPAPDSSLLLKLSADPELTVRAKAVYLLGLHPEDAVVARLVELLKDPQPLIRRISCESLLRIGKPVPTTPVVALLSDPDRFVAWAARLLIERQPVEKWRMDVIDSYNTRLFIVGSVALLKLGPSQDTLDGILHRGRQLLNESIGDANRVDLLRVFQLALLHGGKDSPQAKGLCAQMSQFFPEDDWRCNRELVQLLVYLQDPTLAPRLVAELNGGMGTVDKLHMAMFARFLQTGWTPALRHKLLEYYETVRGMHGGNGLRPYFFNATDDFVRLMPLDERFALLAEGTKLPSAVLHVVRNLPPELSAEQLAALRKLDQQLAGDKRSDAVDLAAAVLLCLGHAGDEPTLAYLHDVYESTPDRRSDVATAIAQYALTRKQRPEDRELLIRSLTVVEGETARTVLKALARFDFKDAKPEALREVILAGLKLAVPEGNHNSWVRDLGSPDAVILLEHWTGQKMPGGHGDFTVRDWDAVQATNPGLVAWQKWFSRTYPDQQPAKLPVGSREDKYSFKQIMEFLGSDRGGQADAKRGAVVFEKALCIKCHKFGNRGEGIGPDLTTVSRRFQRKEILESVLYPSAVISDQFATHVVITRDGHSFAGIVSQTSGGVSVMQSDLKRVEVAKDNIDQIATSHISTMPERLFNPLTLDEIADLFAYLAKPPK